MKGCSAHQLEDLDGDKEHQQAVGGQEEAHDSARAEGCSPQQARQTQPAAAQDKRLQLAGYRNPHFCCFRQMFEGFNNVQSTCKQHRAT